MSLTQNDRTEELKLGDTLSIKLNGKMTPFQIEKINKEMGTLKLISLDFSWTATIPIWKWYKQKEILKKVAQNTV